MDKSTRACADCPASIDDKHWRTIRCDSCNRAFRNRVTRDCKRVARYGSTELPARPPRRRCLVAGCTGIHNGHGLCRTHYNRWRRAVAFSGVCSVSECSEGVEARGKCRRHYQAEYDRERYRRDRDRIIAWNLRWYRRGTLTVQINRASKNATRRARKRQTSVGRVSYRAVLARWGMTCHLCGARIEARNELHFDHVLPLARGGPHIESNIRPAHGRCNLRKGARANAPSYPKH